ncbi:vanadium-dependent haloperoxidase [Methylomagnum ishizawai]|uniref:vanadium-dependent haloperoxidase n=1 Tax=Methylomagnum ishizawai TaxID=1760988 RepID=UPI001C328D12|nr:vanadium-dependent haloperoxidase [Methylomagnum ishizawai]BBL73367.1 haloperoxidase [Methylomagnum ishizawai]
MHTSFPPRLSALALGVAALLSGAEVRADAVTDWNEYAVQATKGFDGTTGTGVALNSNLSTRIEAIQGRAVFDAVNAIDHFSPKSYYHPAGHTGSAAAAAAQAAHDVLLGQLPNPTVAGVDARWAQTRSWLDAKLAQYLAQLGVAAGDPGIQAGKDAAAAAIAARKYDNAAAAATYGADLVPTANPGPGLWRQSNAGAVYNDPETGAPTGFDASGTAIQGRPGIDLNWRDVTPFSLTTAQKIKLVAAVPLSPEVGSPEYVQELDYVKNHGQDSAHPGLRTGDQAAQALYYKQDAEIFVFEAARIAATARRYTLDQNAKLFALLGNAVADARFAAFDSKYQQKFWRPITALNADASGAVNDYGAWHPLAATPAHPSNTAGHSATGAAGFEVLRAFFGDKVLPGKAGAATLTTLPWLVGTNNGTGNTQSRTVATFSQAQLENGASRLYLGVHFGFDNLQGQLLGLAVADAILLSGDPAAAGLRARGGFPASRRNLQDTLLAAPEVYGYFGAATQVPPTP